MSQTQRSPREAVERIQDRYLDAADDVLESLSGHSDVVQMNFAESYFPLEFIQNADDEGASSIRFRIRSTDSGIVLEILNDGRPFTEPDVPTSYEGKRREDISGLCKAGQSPKTPRNHIGFIGVGFKSIFEVSTDVEIHSGGFHFEFSKHRALQNGEDLPWRVLPWWVDDNASRDTAPIDIDGTCYRTQFIAHLNDDAYEDDGTLFTPVTPENLDRRVFLFLSELDEIVIDDQIAETTRVLRRGNQDQVPAELRAAITDAREEYPIDASIMDSTEPIRPLVVEEQRDDADPTEDYWIVFSNRWTVPPEVQDDPTTENYFRADVQARDIFVAIKADDTGQLTVPAQRSGTLHTGVFSYLPLKELETDFGFLVHADFLTPADRQTIKRNVLWNKRIVDALVETLETVVDTVADHPTWWRNLGILVPGEEGGDFIVDQLQKPLRNYIRKTRLFRDAEGTRVTVDDCIRVTTPVVNHLTIDEVEEIKSRRPLHPAQRDAHEKLKPTADTHDFYDHLTNTNAPSVFKSIGGTDRATTVFSAILEELANERSKYRQDRGLRTTGLLTEDGQVVGHQDENVFLPPANPTTDRFDTDPFDDVKAELHLLDRDVRALAGESAETVYDNIELNPITDEEIIRIWVQTVDLTNQTPADRRRAAAFCFSGVQDGTFDAGAIEGLLLETMDGEWCRPAELFLPMAYEPAQPAHRLSEFDWLEDLPEYVRRDRFGPVDGIDDSLRFVTPAYGDRSEGDMQSWQSFLRGIGVDAILLEDSTKREFVGALGELYVYHRLNETGQLQPQNAHIGRDLSLENVRDETTERIIEVKSTSDQTPSVNLTKTQTEVLKAHEDRYWVYAVTETLISPSISTAKGPAIRNRGETAIEVSSQTWSEIKQPF